MNSEEKILEILEQHSKMLEQMNDRLLKQEVTQENVVIPQLQALAEGQANLLATLAPKNRVEALEDEMAFMKSVIKALSQEVAELKKAQ